MANSLDTVICGRCHKTARECNCAQEHLQEIVRRRHALSEQMAELLRQEAEYLAAVDKREAGESIR